MKNHLRNLLKLLPIFIVFSVLLIIVPKVDTPALYNGTSTTQLPQSGYIFIDIGGGKAKQCGINYVSDKVGITAAHCLAGAQKVYAGVGNYMKGFGENAPRVSSFNSSPNYSKTDFAFNPGYADVGVVVFSDAVKVNQYAFITAPKATCNYYLVGYGKSQNGSNFDRTGTDVCIKNISENAFELTFSGDSHFCVGDSGSGIYEKNSNNMVGLVSAFYTNLGQTGCENARAFIATRLDTNMDYLSRYIPASAYKKDQPPAQETVPKDYFDEYYPETKDKDGKYNYENEILLEVERLNELFKNIYPDGGTTIPSPSVISPTPDNVFDEDNTEDVKASDYLVLLGLCICCLLLIGGILVIIILLMKRKSKN